MERRRFVTGAGAKALASAATAAAATPQGATPDPAQPVASVPGPLLMPGLLQPLDLRYEYAELHVMLWLDGHPLYESIEAMIGPGDAGPRHARVILTRHDQSQVDHVSDPRTLHDLAGLDRRVVHRTMSIACRADQSLPTATVRLLSWRDEPIVFTVTALSPPDAARAGLTDPGEHSATASLPVMLRERSTLAGPGSGVTIDGQACALATLPAPGPRGPLTKGYVTVGHHLPALRASERAFLPSAGPARWSVGETWRVDDGRGERVFTIRDLDDRGQVSIACGGERAEVVHLIRDASGLRLSGLEVRASSDARRIARLRFGSTGGFAIDVGDRRGLVTGPWWQTAPDAFGLTPAQPAWASRRAVTIGMRRDGDRIVVRTRIG